MPEEAKRVLALFDLDGTLIPWDTQMLFSNYVVRRHGWRRLFLLPFLLALPFYLIGLVSELAMKRIYLGYLKGLSLDRIDKLAHDFVEETVLPSCYPEIMERLHEHQAKGDLCVLVSASPTLYAGYVGKSLGFELTLGSDTENIDPFPFFPKMPFGNNKGITKVNRLRSLGLLPEEGANPPTGSIAYSDSTADLPMLFSCEQAVLVNPSVKLLKNAHGRAWETVTPKRPWNTKTGKSWKIFLQLLGLYTYK